MKTKAENNNTAIKLYALAIAIEIEIELFLHWKSDIEQLKLNIFTTMTLIAWQVSVDQLHESRLLRFYIHFLGKCVSPCM